MCKIRTCPTSNQHNLQPGVALCYYTKTQECAATEHINIE